MIPSGNVVMVQSIISTPAQTPGHTVCTSCLHTVLSSYLTGVARDIVCDSAWGPAAGPLGCLGAMAATVIIAVDTVIGVIAQQLIMPGLGPELSQHCTLVSVSTVAAVSAARCATPRPQSPEYPSPHTPLDAAAAGCCLSC